MQQIKCQNFLMYITILIIKFAQTGQNSICIAFKILKSLLKCYKFTIELIK